MWKRFMLSKFMLSKFMLRKRMLKKLGMMLLAVGVSALLSSCLVDKKKLETIDNTDTNLRIYQPTDHIDYFVQVDDVSGTQVGTMQVKWESTNPITNPLTIESYSSILKETTTLTINGGDPEVLVRYIEQDVNGSMYIRAFDSSELNKYFWLSSESTGLPGSLQRFEIFRSPLAMTGEINLGDFYVFGDCTGTNCPPPTARYYNRIFKVTGTNETLSISAGEFTNIYTVQYNAYANPDATMPILDVLDICGSGGLTMHEAKLYVAPKIGIIRTENICTDSGGGGDISIYTITLDTTSISY